MFRGLILLGALDASAVSWARFELGAYGGFNPHNLAKKAGLLGGKEDEAPAPPSSDDPTASMPLWGMASLITDFDFFIKGGLIGMLGGGMHFKWPPTTYKRALCGPMMRFSFWRIGINFAYMAGHVYLGEERHKTIYVFMPSLDIKITDNWRISVAGLMKSETALGMFSNSLNTIEWVIGVKYRIY